MRFLRAVILWTVRILFWLVVIALAATVRLLIGNPKPGEYP